jgi:hypothetical protein
MRAGGCTSNEPSNIEAPLTFLSIPAAEKHDIPFAMFVAECSCLRVCSTKPGLLSRVDGSLASKRRSMSGLPLT